MYPYFYGYYFDSLYLLIAGISLVIMLSAQILVKSRYSKYSKIPNSRGLTGAQAAKSVLEANGVYDVRIEQVSGQLTDHYDPKNNVIRLSEGVYSSNSVAAVGIAAHEAGHAVQYAKSYFPIKVRTAIIPLVRIGPTIGILMMIIGAFINMFNLIVWGIVLFGLTFVFQFVTLPVEFNASRRALVAIREGHLLDDEGFTGAKKVLTAAALTYVAAMIQSLLTLLYYATRFLGNRRR